MSQILASHLLLPAEDDHIEEMSLQGDARKISLGGCQKISIPGEKLIPSHQRKMLRSISRATTLLSGACWPLHCHFHNWIEKDPFAVGVYCAVESVPVDIRLAQLLSRAPESEWMEIFNTQFAPKNALKINLGVASASLGLLLGAMGPVNTFYESNYGVLHALQEAELDLFQGRIQVAVVGATQSLDDDLMNWRKARTHPNQIQKENAVALVLTANGALTKWEDQLSFANNGFGISSPLIEYVQKKDGL